jgi:lysine biosynthesis protein LysW
MDLSQGLEQGEIVVCPDFGVESEVITIDPGQIASAPEVKDNCAE